LRKGGTRRERLPEAARPAPEARRHFETARVEFLKGIRALIDARIAHFAKPQPKGEKITVE
jgi:hypothetical protein